MPLFKSKTFKPDEIVVAWTSYATASIPGVTPRGTRARGDDPRVLAYERAWVRDGTPIDRMPSDFDAVVANAEATDAAERARIAAAYPVIEDADAVICYREFTERDPETKSLRHVVAGQRYRRSDPIVERHLECFKTVGLPLAP